MKKIIKSIIKGNSRKKILIIGPCSIHSFRSYLFYSRKIKSLKFKNIIIVMRVYLEKPRTTIGWKGIIYDPDKNGTYNINKGINKAIKILKNSKKNKINVACELLNPNIFGYIKKYIDILTIGARNNEGQIYREVASSLKIPVGFKNNVNGEIEGSINSIISCKYPTLYSINNKKKINWKISKGNKKGFLILRGGIKPNYNYKYVKKYIKIINKNKIKTGVIIDTSHSNSNKIFKRQIKISYYILNKIMIYLNRVIGIMIESHIYEGNQIISKNISHKKSITDTCISWFDTKKIIKKYEKKLYKLFI
ncbi:3-deoxy-7-phosphoheptulonate synthase [Candidatus Vidania fulgoroideorum]